MNQQDGLVLSSVKKCEDRDSVVIRLFNPTGNEITGSIKIEFDIKEAYSLKLNEEREGRLSVIEKTINVAVIPGKIYTLEVVLM